MNLSERRRQPRIKQQIPLKIKLDNYDVAGQTNDISCIGAYCKVNKHIPPFSLISIILLLPIKNDKRSRICNVHCQGVVVRSEENPENNKEYNIAIYFSRLKSSDKDKLLQYLRQYT